MLSIIRLSATALAVTIAVTTVARAQQEAPEGTRGGWRDACKRDMATYSCRRLDGGSAKRLCLDANLLKLSAPCRTALDQRRQTRAQVRMACAPEILTLCKEAGSGGGAQIDCLQQKIADVGPVCSKALAVLAPLTTQPADKAGKAAPPKK